MMVKKVLILVAVLPVLALLAYALTLDPRSIPSPLVGRQAGDFTLSLFDGGRFTLGGAARQGGGAQCLVVMVHPGMLQ